ncbi:MAG: M56 family metallopeptidase [Lachnospiraceae bacterium]|nr:M56 family metallopeptidase [Lachnospiraceae bacterium]
MTKLLLCLINRSIAAGWLILVVLLARVMLQKAPKWVNVLLWGIVAVWLTGAILLFAFLRFRYWRLYRLVATAVRLRDNIFQSEYIRAPFILGVRKPKIYIPFGMDSQNMQYVILHEKAHIRRGDHCLKLVGALLLSIYWFHPLVWLAYALLCRDIELACDEKVIRHLDRAGRAEVRTAHTGWNTIVLYQSEGADYLLQYQPTMYQGIGSYTCTMLSLEGGREVVENEWSTEFTLPVRQLTWKMRGFAEQVNFMLKNGTVLLSAGEEGCVIEPKPGTEVGQVYPVIFEPKEASFEKISSEEKQDTTKGYRASLPFEEPSLMFWLASGAGGWCTELTLYQDGRFEGVYEDGEGGFSSWIEESDVVS